MALKRKPSILAQLTIGFTAILLFVMTATVTVTYVQTSRSSLNQTARLLLDSITHLSGKLDANLIEYDKMTQVLAFNEVVQNHLSSRNPGSYNEELIRVMNASNRTSGHESNIMILDRYGSSYLANSSMDFLWRSIEAVRKQPWYDEMEQYKGRMLWFSGLVWVGGAQPAVIGARSLNNIETLENIGTIVFAYPAITLQKTIGQMNLGKNGKVQVVDSFGRVVYSSVWDDVGTPAPSVLLEQVRKVPSDMITLSTEDGPAYISYAYSDYSGWTVLAYIDRGEVYEGVSRLQRTILWISIAGLSVGILFITFYSWTLVRPIRFLAKRIERIDEGHLLPVRRQLWNAEVTGLYESFNRMLARLQQTIRDLTDKQVSERQAQFVALRAQFRPHFLYNTLNTIYWTLEGKRDTAAAAEMVQLLSELLRYSIQPGSEMTTVREDVAQLKRYITLQKYRYGERLDVELDIDEELLDCRCMKLLLQPIVENAMTHGLESVKRDQWKIRIRIRREDRDMVLTVDDNGTGMSEREMREILSEDAPRRSDSRHTGIGLPNLQERIQYIYGRSYGITLSGNEWGGLRVTVRIPIDPDGGGKEGPENARDA